MSPLSPSDQEIVGEAVLRDYPLRLWARQQQHTDEVLREFALMLGGQELGGTSAPAQLLQLAQMFTESFGGLIDQANSVRQERYDAGADRMDWRVPLPRSAPDLIRRVQAVWAAVDAHCASDRLLALARPPEVVALQNWATAEIAGQAQGGDPTPWPGPFQPGRAPRARQ